MKFKLSHLFSIVAISCVFLTSGCDLLGLKTGEKCSGTLDSVKTTATLAGFGDSDYELATPTTGVSSDSALLSSACPATFTLYYRFSKQGIQSALNERIRGTSIANVKAAIGLTHYEDGFHVNSELTTFTATATFGLAYVLPDTVKSIYITLKDHGDYPGSGSRGKFFIKTGLKGLVLDPDSSITMRGVITYYH